MKLGNKYLLIWIAALAVIMMVLFCGKSDAAESICFTNKFVSDVHLWTLGNKDGEKYKTKHIEPGKTKCYMVDNGKMLLIKFEINHFVGSNFQQRWISIKTVKAGNYNILIGKTDLKLRRGIK